MHKGLLHSIVNMWENDPNTMILIRKDDFKSAYILQHLSAQAAIQSTTQITWKGALSEVISLRLNFSGANGPTKWRTINEPIAELRKALLLDDTWEPRETQDPNQDSITPASTLDNSILFAHSIPLVADTLVDPQGKVDIYLDNCIIVVPYISNNRARVNAAMLLKIHAVSHPLAQQEPVLRDKIIET